MAQDNPFANDANNTQNDAVKNAVNSVLDDSNTVKTVINEKNKEEYYMMEKPLPQYGGPAYIPNPKGTDSIIEKVLEVSKPQIKEDETPIEDLKKTLLEEYDGPDSSHGESFKSILSRLFIPIIVTIGVLIFAILVIVSIYKLVSEIRSGQWFYSNKERATVIETSQDIQNKATDIKNNVSNTGFFKKWFGSNNDTNTAQKSVNSITKEEIMIHHSTDIKPTNTVYTGTIEGDTTIQKAHNLMLSMRNSYYGGIQNRFNNAEIKDRMKVYNDTISEINNYKEEGKIIYTRLQNEIISLENEMNTQKEIALEEENGIRTSFEKNDGSSVEKHAIINTQAKNAYNTAITEREIRTMTLKKMSEYGAALQNIEDSLIANKDAIINNIQVVDFAKDPFERVIKQEEYIKKSTK